MAESSERVVDTRCEVGEGPLWHTDEGALYWCDIVGERLFRYAPGEAYETVLDGTAVSGFTAQSDGSLLCFTSDGAVLTWDAASGLTPADLDGPDSGFNDVVAGPEGRVFCGVTGPEDGPGALYRLDTDGSFTRVVDDVDLPNGMGFSPDRERFYFTDSGVSEGRQGRIYAFDYERSTGALSNERTFARVPERHGVPDGLTVDADGYVWSARWDGGHLARHAPDGEVVERVPFDARKVSSVAFGGPDLDDLYVTTAGGSERESEGSGAGALFRFRPGTGGPPEFRSRLSV